MKILVVCQHYWPEPYPLTDICEELVKRGHTVDLVTDVPNYPQGETYPGYINGQRREEEHNGVKIFRTFTIPRKHNAICRLLNYYSFAISSTAFVKRLREDYDVVFTNQTSPVMMSSAAFTYGRMHNKKVVMYCMDLWPACLAAGGITESSIIYKFFGCVSKRLYNKADKILITSQMFRQYLEEQHGVNDKKIEYLPQYAPTQFEHMPETYQNKNTVDLMFAGNIGAAQNLQLVLAAADQLRTEDELRWHIVGDGSELANLKKYAQEKKLYNVIFHGRQPSQDMPKYYGMADAMLVTLIPDPFISLTLPGKVQTYMAAGKPILASASGEIPAVLSAARCGYCAAPGDVEAFVKVVKQFLQSDEKVEMGNKAREYYLDHFTKNHFMDHLESVLEKHVIPAHGRTTNIIN